MAEPWASFEDVAKHSVDRWIDKKGLPAHRMARLWKFRLSEVDV